MKRNMIIAAAVAVAGVATYLLRRKMGSGNVQQTGQGIPRSNHLTNVFSKAKQHSMNA